MLFAAGMGIGLMFFGVSESMSHFGSSIVGISVEDGGVKILSEINMVLALLLLLFILFVGPTGEILSTTVSGGAAYIAQVIPLSMPFGREDSNFPAGWTSFYWAWWVSWSTFVGMFIARVSRGRTLREFIICVILVPTAPCVLWIATFGGNAISQVVVDASDPVAAAAQELKLFEMVREFPMTGVLLLIGIVLVLVFFVTSSDSGSLVIDTITVGGKTNAPVQQRVFWCTFEGLVAAILLPVGGAEALSALQAMTVSTGLPFAIVLVVMCYSTRVGLSRASKGL